MASASSSSLSQRQIKRRPVCGKWPRRRPCCTPQFCAHSDSAISLRQVFSSRFKLHSRAARKQLRRIVHPAQQQSALQDLQVRTRPPAGRSSQRKQAVSRLPLSSSQLRAGWPCDQPRGSKQWPCWRSSLKPSGACMRLQASVCEDADSDAGPVRSFAAASDADALVQGLAAASAGRCGAGRLAAARPCRTPRHGGEHRRSCRDGVPRRGASAGIRDFAAYNPALADAAAWRSRAGRPVRANKLCLRTRKICSTLSRENSKLQDADMVGDSTATHASVVLSPGAGGCGGGAVCA